MHLTEESYYEELDERTALPATMRDLLGDWARSVGDERPEVAWLLSDLDVWVRNPYYRGPAAPHPECDEAEMDAFISESMCPARPPVEPARVDLDDDLPF